MNIPRPGTLAYDLERLQLAVGDLRIAYLEWFEDLVHCLAKGLRK